MSWDGFQREVLAELGLTPYRLAVGGPAADEEEGDVPQSLLRAALARAAGCDPDRLPAFGLPLSALAGDPAAKRALWPHLRRLRARARADG